MPMNQDATRKSKFARIILAYPVALILAAIFVNMVVIGVEPAVIAEPRPSVIASLAIGAILLLGNHTWLMTSTELTRLRYDLHATPEEWAASGHDRTAISAKGQEELERHHNAHRNTTENVVYFVLLALVVSIVSPAPWVAETWIIGFALGRLGHTFSYLAGHDGLRGISMSVSLLSLYGFASYLAICWMI